MQHAPIVIVEDDSDDCEFLVAALKDIGVKNKIECFDNAEKALHYLKSTDKNTFLIISDINMPFMNGLEFKQSINTDDCLKNKKIPFVFLSTSNQPIFADKAFDLCAHGYFRKPTNMLMLNSIMKVIIDYWKNNLFNTQAEPLN